MQKVFLAGLSISFFSLPGYTLLPEASLLGAGKGDPSGDPPPGLVPPFALSIQPLSVSLTLYPTHFWLASWQGTFQESEHLQILLFMHAPPSLLCHPVLTVQAGFTHSLVDAARLGHTFA